MAATYYAEYNTTPSAWVADTKAQILNQTDWSNITGNIVKATTTRGAQMVIDLNKSAPLNNYATVSFFTTHNGSTGTDEVTRYLHWKQSSGGTTSNSLHCFVSVSKEHLLIGAEGPYGVESNTDNADLGSKRSILLLADIVPYHAGDTVACVAMWGNNSTSSSQSTGNYFLAVSKDQSNTGAWVTAQGATLTGPMSADNTSNTPLQFQHRAKGDGKTYIFPLVIVEMVDGLRGRLNNLYWAGWSRSNANMTGDNAGGLSEGDVVTYSSHDYVIKRVVKGSGSGSTTYFPWGGTSTAGTTNEPQFAIQKT
jgi:hypothetical protein